MSIDDIAAAVLECVGGYANVIGDSLCATRLRIALNELDTVDRPALQSINGVLGVADRGSSGIEVVFGPNLVRGVFLAFQHLVGPKDGTRPDAVAPTSLPRSSNFQVSITPETPGLPNQPTMPQAYEATPPQADDLDDQEEIDDTAALLGLLSDPDGFDEDLSADGLSGLREDALDLDALQGEDDTRDRVEGLRLMVVNGPNINLLGLRETEPYGEDSFSDLLLLCHESAREAGFVECECYQSNHEGDLVDWVQDAYDLFDGIVINPGAYGHSSIALMEALLEVAIPAIEVHIGRPVLYEELGGPSLTQRACLKTIEGKGIAGYREAILDLAAYLDKAARE